MPTRILHVVPNMNMGGLETFIMNVYRNIDRSKIQFDFLMHYKEESFYDKEIKNLGGKIYHFSLRNDSNIFKYLKELNSFFKEHKEYKTIHCHMESVGFIVFLVAKKYGINIRIGHAHTTNQSKTIKGILKRILSAPFKYTTTINLACSSEAGKYLYGNKPFNVINNGIDFRRFDYDKKIRLKIREELNLKDELVIGHIGRMDNAKNQIFLINLLTKIEDKRIKLVLVGDGELRKYLEDKVKRLSLTDRVIFLGVRDDVNLIYNAFDIFMFPSLFEGLPLTLIEAQINKLPCFVSSNITRECIISNNINFLDLDDIDSWKNIDNKNRGQTIFNNDKDFFNIKNTINKLEKFYK